MKKMLKKIFASILTIALIASVCTMVPVFAENAEETAEMYFDNTYADLWNSSVGNNFNNNLLVSESTTATYGAKIRVSGTLSLTVQNAVNGNASRYGYVFGDENEQTTDDTLVISLPQEDGYMLSSVGVRVVGPSGATSMDLFDYSFSGDNSAYTNAGYKASGSLGNTDSTAKQKAFNHTLKVPADAHYLKIKLNSNYNADGDYYVGVFGFTFAYIPVGNYETLSVSATTGGNLINILSSGLLDEGSTNWVLLQDKVTTGKPFGINLINDTSPRTSILKFPDGWKFTTFSAIHSLNGGTQNRVVTVGLGTETAALSVGDSSGGRTLACSYPSGHNVLNFTGSTSVTSGFTNINITMKKSALSTSVENSVINADNVSVDVKVSDVFASDYSTMELIVAGYDGDTLAGVDIIPINKNDEETLEKGFKEVTATLPKNTTMVRAFLWKDLTTLVPILPATPAFTVE